MKPKIHNHYQPPCCGEMIDEMTRILDACCGSRMCWFDKHNPEAVYMDIRQETDTLCDGRTLEVKPDIVGDFRDMPFESESFPTWADDIKQGFSECMRVLKPNGVLIFKWNEQQISTDKILEIVGKQPLFGHTSGKGNHTIWMCFMK